MPRIPRAILDEMVAHARADLPNEACGIVHAREGVPVASYRVKNAAASPYRYLMDPMQQYRLETQRDESGETLFAIYHSHVASEGRPSQTDRRQAFFPPAQDDIDFDRDPAYPGTWYILVSLAEEPPTVRAFQVSRGGIVDEEPIETATLLSVLAAAASLVYRWVRARWPWLFW